MIGSLIALTGLLGMVGLCGVAALNDRTPRRQLAPEEVRAIYRDRLWWTVRRSKRETARSVIAMGSEKQA